MKKNIGLIKNMYLVSLGITFSRVLGYIRDMLVATTFGAGFYADAFFAAFRIPNLFRRLFGESSLNAAFVPVFSEYIETKSKPETENLISAVYTVLFVLLGGFTVIGIIFAPYITKIITFGFTKDKLMLTSKLLQIMFPYMWLICLAALGLSILTCLKVFFIPAASSSSLSISEILFILFIVNLLPEEKKVLGLAVSVLVGGFLQWGINFYLIKLKKYKTQLNLKNFVLYLFSPPIKKITFLFFPVVVGFSVDQINALVDTLCASFLKEGSITALYYSNRLMQLPLALFGTALATVALPQMSAEAAVKSYENMRTTVNSSFRNILYFILPASIGLMILGKPIIITLFEHGKFTREATIMTYSCLFFYSLGLISFSTSKILTSAFYAVKQPNIPVKAAGICMLLNAGLNVILMQFLSVGGLALATSISSTVFCIILYFHLKKIFPEPVDKEDIIPFLKKIFLANILFSGTILVIYYLIKNPFLATFVGVVFGIIIYVAITKILKIEETKIIFSFINKFIPLLPEE